MPETDIVKEQQQVVATSENEEDANSVSSETGVSADSTVLKVHHVYGGVDTFTYSAHDLPEPMMNIAYLDSCVKNETVTLPVDLQELTAPTMTAFDSLMVQLSNVSDTTYVFQQRTSHSLNGAYEGKPGANLPNTLQGQVWFTPLMFLLFIGYGLVFALRSKALVRDVKEFFAPRRQSSSTGGDVVEQKTQYRFALTMLGIVCLSVFAIQALHVLSPKLGPSSYLLAVGECTAVSFAFYLFKRLSSSYLGFVFFGKAAVREWSHTFNFLLGGLGLCLFPIVLCLAYSLIPIKVAFVNFGFAISILAEFILLIAIISRFFKHKFSILYLFLYLCTLEVLPLAAMLFGYYNIIATV